MADPAGPGGPIDSLLAHLRKSSSTSTNPTAQPGIYQQSATQQDYPVHQSDLFSPIVSPPARNPQRHSSSSMMSASLQLPAASSPAPAATTSSNGDRTASLLNLLKSSQQRPASQSSLPIHETATPPQTGQASGAISASDLVAQFMGRPYGTRSSSALATPVTEPDAPRQISQPKPTGNQEFLLNLLNRAKSPREEQPLTKADEKRESDERPIAPAKATPSSPHIFGGKENSELKPFEPPQVAASNGAQSMFTYVNPFEQLAASSPRNRTPKAEASRSSTPKYEILKPARNDVAAADGAEAYKRKSLDASPAPEPASARRKLSPRAPSRPSNPSSPAHHGLSDGRSPLEAMMGIGAAKQSETVANAVTEVAEQVGREMEESLSKAEGVAATKSEPSVAEELKAAAIEVKEELAKEENEGALEDSLPNSIAEAVKETIEKAASGEVLDSWESAEGDEERRVQVYNFPIRPFTQLDLKPLDEARAKFHDDSIMDIARLKKEFDQIDRNLVSATKDFIVYGMSKNGGFRIIRQDDGRDKQVLKNTGDRIFNVATATLPIDSSSAETEAVLGTGLSGSVYWVPMPKADDEWDSMDLQASAIVFPPVQSAEDNQLKTRVKPSNRHPEFFAIGVGKAIYIIWPSVAGSPAYGVENDKRTVNATKYLGDRCRKIATGKAGKDFVFSEDDSVIASVDKLGRLRIWDIRNLISGANGVLPDASSGGGKLPPIEVKTPMMTLMTITPSEKAWPSSVLFVDKTRPYTRGVAQRYVIVGMRQNHTLQLWDLALGKAVQELSLPHESESDAICSIAYHPATGVVVVGHPTRNSVYLIHLSAPRYNLSPISQAKYLERLAQHDSGLPKPEATAIMSGMREFSLSIRGQLRSLDVLSSPPTTADDPDDPVFFQIYAMHSKGVTCLDIKRADLGWDKDCKPLYPVDAAKEGLLSVSQLRELTVVVSDEAAEAPRGDPPAVSHKSSAAIPSTKTSRKADIGAKKTLPIRPAVGATTDSNTGVGQKTETGKATRLETAEEPGLRTNGAEKKKKKKAPFAAVNPEVVVLQRDHPVPDTEHHGLEQPSTIQRLVTSPIATPTAGVSPSKAGEASMAVQGSTAEVVDGEKIALLASAASNSGGFSADIFKKEIKTIEQTVSVEFSKVISSEMERLYRRVEEDKRIQQASNDAKQDAVLRLVSSTLSENVEKSLARMIGQSVNQAVLPAIADVTRTSIDQIVSQTLREQLQQLVPREVKTAVTETVGRVFQDPAQLGSMSDLVATKVAAHVESEMSSILHGTITPAFKDMSLTAMEGLARETERRTHEQLRHTESQRRNDSVKIDQLQELVRGLTQTVSQMAEAQTDFQNEILKLQRQVGSQRHSMQGESSRTSSRQQTHTPTSHPQRQMVVQQKTPEQIEQEMIAGLMRDGQYEEATIKWLHSRHQGELFDRFFVRFEPSYIQSLSTLVLLSVAAAVTDNFGQHVEQRLIWLDACLKGMDPEDTDAQEVMGRIMGVMIQRLEGLYMSIAELNPNEPVLRRIPALTRIARDLKGSI
ncbi:MAG: hypothetical protein M1817_003665 [Caeruleum heppii]|nr:MAG: hypothetical protein M1817_003665 [Caeruleum heppii]